ncbi:MAG: glycoside hydrolase [Lachnospiraceae bacterium]|nr:glycoside hydrolase [Lachnospiraceae bacterium]
MRKVTFGTPEEIVPSQFCKGLAYQETEIQYDVTKFKFRETKRGCLLEFPIEQDEQIYGFGLQLKGFNHKSHKLTLRANSDPVANTGDSHAPVPFFVTTKGYGMYLDTARYIEVCCGYGKNTNRPPEPNNTIIATAEDLYKKCGLKETSVMSIEIPVAKGVDVYIFEGENILDIVSQYNMFSGGGCQVPEWGLGVIYRMYAKFTDKEVMNLADYFREREIPVDIIGLEPGWQSSSYSCSYVWDEERYPEYGKMIAHLKEQGYHINLWEHAFVNAVSPIYKPLQKYCGDYEVWKGLIPDLSIPEARDIFADYHKKNLVELGIDGFKLDECDNSDFVHDWSFPNCTEFPGGMDGEQYHQMFGTLYMQTILQALDGRETLSEVRNAGALAASYPFVLYSDLYDHKDFIRGVVNSGFSGLLWTPEVREARSRKEFLRRLQSNVFSCQCLINAWYLDKAPWLAFDCEDEVRELLNVRHSLIPMLKKAFDEYKETGKPPIRALVADYTEDSETWALEDEYIFCDNLIVAPMTAAQDSRKVYLPEGSWRDYWTKEPAASGWRTVETDQIPVFEKAE